MGSPSAFPLLWGRRHRGVSIPWGTHNNAGRTLIHMMAQAPTLQTLVDDVLAHAPALAQALHNGIQDELKARLEHHLLLAGWSRRRAQFADDFQGSLKLLLGSVREGRDPLQRERRAAGLDTMTLVDQHQAMKDVAIAHVINTVEDHCRPELHQLGNFFAALRGIARPLKNDNPLRAALFAQALLRTVQGVDLDDDGRAKLMKVAAHPLGVALQPVFGRLCQQLRQAQLTGLVASHGASQESDLRMRQFKALSQEQGPHTTLDEVALKFDIVHSMPAPLAGARDESPQPRLGPGSPGAAQGQDLLSRLYDEILSDARLQPALKVLMGRLQVAIVRLARNDATLLKRQEHPTWRLLNRIAAHGAGFSTADAPELREFLSFLERAIQPLLDAERPAASQFEQALEDINRHIRSRAEQRVTRNTVALERLDREQQRQDWQGMLREHLQHQLDDAQAGKLMRRFLLGPWVEVIAEAMVTFGREAPEAHAYVDVVDGLLHSVQPHPEDAQRQQLRARLPALIRTLEAGMASIALPPMQREAFLDELMRQHGRVLRGQPAVEERPLPGTGGRPALTSEEVLAQLLTERESQLPSRWSHQVVDRGHLPTVPVTLYSEQHSPDARVALQDWINGLQIGAWLHLFVQSEWTTAQISWISESRQLFLFVGQAPEERHTITRGALEQLVANGLITLLEEEPLLQRALGTLMLDLQQQR